MCEKWNKPLQVEPKEHHVQQQLCYTRAPYRQGREFKAVKVYTIADESSHLLVQNVPALNLESELKKRLGGSSGTILNFKKLTEYPPLEAFSETYHVSFSSLKLAKMCKKKLDGASFYGSHLHICYAPELESVTEAETKIRDRVNFVNSIRNRKTFSYNKP